MKPTAYFINARSRMVRYDDLYEVLKEGRIAGAALDDEPLEEGSPWLELENATLTPHVVGTSTSTWENSVRMVAEAVRELEETEGTVFNHKGHVEDLQSNFEVTRVRLTGGGSQSELWSQMFAGALEPVSAPGVGARMS